MLDVSHNGWLVAAAFAVALMAGFTGLSLTRGASSLPPPRRKLVVVIAAVILGGGIWSMHFVAMLGLQLPILFYYDALVTLISALVAILVVGLALLLLHFCPRRRAVVIGAGVAVGLGIVAMHYIGMAGMRICRPVYGPGDIAISTLASVVLSVAAIWVAYGERTHRNILLGTVCFAAAVVSMHFTAISLTDFVATGQQTVSGPALSNETLAMGVTVAVFLICGAFLLTGITFIGEEEPAPTELTAPAAPPAAMPDAVPDAMPGPAPTEPAPVLAGVPFEREGQTHFAPRDRIAAIRAEGHYTLLYVEGEKLFCPWSISEAERRLSGSGFLRVHRSYLVNPRFVTRFERTRDNGVCHFEATAALGRVPVSRSRLPQVREALGL